MPHLDDQSPLIARCRFLAAAMLGAYVVLNALLAAVTPITVHWPVYGVTALTIPPMVLAMIYLVIPLARRL
ncbi:MAG TPA: hypothetical protein VKX28_31925 [Xanthobacteraceae bacterium]|nr:hypothetical protein [Xanthobacteraceae bacterium]